MSFPCASAARAVVVILLIGTASNFAKADELPKPEAPAIEARSLGMPKPASPGNVPHAANAEGSPSVSPLSGTLVRTAGSLAMVLGLIFLASKGLKKLVKGNSNLAAALGAGGPSPAGLLEILGRYPVGRGMSLVLLRLDNRVLLLSQSGGGVRLRGGAASLTTLCEITSPEEVASILLRTQDEEQKTIAAGFRQLLHRFDSSHDGPEVVDVRTSRRGRAVVRGQAGDVAELLSERADAPVFAGPDEVRDRSGAGRLRRRLEDIRVEGSR